uniref:Ig-like domain-containing protein n=1 Tax=Anabas testudineus TaxID=64144 RepID=A0AAQ6IFC7_ANATE
NIHRAQHHLRRLIWTQPGKTVCALKGSSVELNCSDKKPTTSMKWYTVNRTGPVTEITAERNDKYKISEENNFNLTINELREGDDKFYCCSQKTDEPQTCRTNGIKLQVTGTVALTYYLQVRVFPTAEDQTVTLIP